MEVGQASLGEGTWLVCENVKGGKPFVGRIIIII